MTTVLLHTGQTAPKLEPRQPEVRVVRGGKHGLNRARQFASVALHVIAVALLLGMIFSVVHSQARITELNGQINDTRTDLTAAQSEYDYLSTKMSDITSRASLQEVAEGQLVLVKLKIEELWLRPIRVEGMDRCRTSACRESCHQFRRW